jgi:hypothetical protein
LGGVRFCAGYGAEAAVKVFAGCDVFGGFVYVDSLRLWVEGAEGAEEMVEWRVRVVY